MGSVCLNAVMLVVHIMGEMIVKAAPDMLPPMLMSYARFRQLQDAREGSIAKETSLMIDSVEFSKMVRTSPVWVPSYATELITSFSPAAPADEAASHEKVVILAHIRSCMHVISEIKV
jgi:hypothetical protein